jgi:hypothetical protein
MELRVAEGGETARTTMQTADVDAGMVTKGPIKPSL